MRGRASVAPRAWPLKPLERHPAPGGGENATALDGQRLAIRHADPAELTARLVAAGLRRRKPTSLGRRRPGRRLVEPPVLRPGDLVAVPLGVDHTFNHRRDDPARILNIHAPGREFAETLRLMAD